MEKLKTMNATSARANLVGLINEVAERHQPVLITAKRGNVVLVGEEDWNLLQEKLHLQSIKGTRDSLIESFIDPSEESFSREKILRTMDGDE